MEMPEALFELDVNALYEKARREVASIVSDSNDDSVLNALFALNHLRDWIYPDGHDAYSKKNQKDYTDEERLHSELYSDPNYKIVRELCNRAKHVGEKENYSTCVREGLIAGLARAGDNLGQKNYLVDGEDLRSIMEKVLEKYDSYFRQRKNAI
jgi:hypothetical protein